MLPRTIEEEESIDTVQAHDIREERIAREEAVKSRKTELRNEFLEIYNEMEVLAI